MREFIMPAGRFSGRRFVEMSPEDYASFNESHSVQLTWPINLIVTNSVMRIKPQTMRELIDRLDALVTIRSDLNRESVDTITLVTDAPMIWEWLVPSAVNSMINHTVAIAKNESMFGILPLPETELILEVKDVLSAVLIPKMPIHQNVSCCVMTEASKIHWLLGVLKQSGRPDISIYVNIKSLSPEMRGASA